MRKAVYAGSFDPITNGHLWMIERGIRLFDELVVAIGVNPDKKYAFSLEERLAMLRETIGQHPNVTIDTFEHLFLVNYAKAVGAQYVLRGIRTEADYEYERGMRHINSDLDPEIEMVFLMPPRGIAEISSSVVKGLVGPAGWQDIVKQYVPEAVYRKFLERFGK
ncbi:pantetheine-phosphate adenylyltransferase [Candidatus Woesearchaeota archaeon]|nr:pantetheine-phosphate adenylyltransferase [Candidatus Woesearchaeota archaeon]